jgi:hypothetical protein
MLAAVVLAIRRAPKRASRAVGLAALILLGLALATVLLRALWVSEVSSWVRAHASGALTAVGGLAPWVGLILLLAIATGLAAIALTWIARRLPSGAWRLMVLVALVTAVTAPAAGVLRGAWSDGVLAAWMGRLARAGSAAASVAAEHSGAIAAVAGAILALWLLARAPARLKRTIAGSVLALAAMAAVGVGGAAIWRQYDLTAKVRPVIADLEKRWGDWTRPRPAPPASPRQSSVEHGPSRPAHEAPAPHKGSPASPAQVATDKRIGVILASTVAIGVALMLAVLAARAALPPVARAPGSAMTALARIGRGISVAALRRGALVAPIFLLIVLAAISPVVWPDSPLAPHTHLRKGAASESQRAASSAPAAAPPTVDPVPKPALLALEEPPSPSAIRPPQPLNAHLVFGKDLHWRFGRADQIGDGRTAFLPVAEALASVDVCAAGSLVVVGMASSEGPKSSNAALSACRAQRLAAVVHARAQSCPGPVRVFTLDLGGAQSLTDDPADRRALIFSIGEGRSIDDQRAKEIDPIVGAHSGSWRTGEATSDEACAAGSK